MCQAKCNIQLRMNGWGKGSIQLQVLALNPVEGMMVELHANNMADSVQMVVLFGGASGKKFSRDGDIGADPESSFYLHAENCKDNLFTLQQHGFRLQYGFSKKLIGRATLRNSVCQTHRSRKRCC